MKSNKRQWDKDQNIIKSHKRFLNIRRMLDMKSNGGHQVHKWKHSGLLYFYFHLTKHKCWRLFINRVKGRTENME